MIFVRHHTYAGFDFKNLKYEILEHGTQRLMSIVFFSMIKITHRFYIYLKLINKNEGKSLYLSNK